jgi:HAD superfamily hydrolase (TIGR01509 family)
MKNKLVIFDCDGVLIDSEIIAHRVGSAEMTRAGFPMTVEKSIELFTGVVHEDMVSIINKEYGKNMMDNDLKATINNIETVFQTDLKLVPGILQVMKHVDEKYKGKCIASNSKYDYLLNVLALVGLTPYFSQSQIFSAAMVKRGKPMPDLFLYAAEKSKVAVADCIVVEDSVVGINAAKAADMAVIGFLGGLHAKNPWYRHSINEAKPDMIAGDVAELLECLS